MRLLIDMNLSPDWVGVFRQQGWEAIHWSTIGDWHAPDHIVMNWANVNGYVVSTHDLDLASLLATTRAQGPSVVQVRTHDVLPMYLGKRLIHMLRQYETMLEKGALLTIDENKSRVRMLPFEWNPPKDHG